MSMAPPGQPTGALSILGRVRPILIEALFEIAICTVLTALPERWYFRLLGLRRIEAPRDEAGGAVPQADIARALAVGQAVESVGRRVAFRAVCLQRALAARRMLSRRGIDVTVHFGLRRHGDAANGRRTLSAHAWTTVGDAVVIGQAPGLADYVVVGRYR